MDRKLPNSAGGPRHLLHVLRVTIDSPRDAAHLTAGRFFGWTIISGCDDGINTTAQQPRGTAGPHG